MSMWALRARYKTNAASCGGRVHDNIHPGSGLSPIRFGSNDLSAHIQDDRDSSASESDLLPLIQEIRIAANKIFTPESSAVMRSAIDRHERHVLRSTKTVAEAVDLTKSLGETLRQLLYDDPKEAVAAFDSLHKIAGATDVCSEARLEAMKVLVQLRSTSSGYIYLTTHAESHYVATMLCRTQESALALKKEMKAARVGQASSNPPVDAEPYQTKWMHDDQAKLGLPARELSNGIVAYQPESDSGCVRIDISAWLLVAIECLRSENDWELLSYVLVHLGSQVGNMRLFRHSLPAIIHLRRILHDQLVDKSMKEPPAATGLKRDDVALCLFNIMTPLIPYASIDDPEIDRAHWADQLIQTFMAGLDETRYDGAFKGCVHALSVCSLEVPESVGKDYPRILDYMAKIKTRPHLAVHVLEFLSQVALLPQVHKHFNSNEKRSIFLICNNVLDASREDQQKRHDGTEDSSSSTSKIIRAGTPSKHAAQKSVRPPYRAQMLQDTGVPLYASALAYHTMISWFLALPLEDRASMGNYLIPLLVWPDKKNETSVDQQAEVFRDMMFRTAFSDLGETRPDPAFVPVPHETGGGAGPTQRRPIEASEGEVKTASWIFGNSILTVETATHTGRSQMIKRQASGTTYASFEGHKQQQYPPHQTPNAAHYGREISTYVLPEHVMLQITGNSAPFDPADTPTRLPDNDAIVIRALKSFDLTPTTDSHKAGVLFLAPGQKMQDDILMNTEGSLAYNTFLSQLGYKVSLDADPGLVNPQGLRLGTDGVETIAWCDRVTEIVFLVPTMMPEQSEADEEVGLVRRMAHVGNCYVNVIFDQSGRGWDPTIIQSQFNYVNIVITPADWINAGDPVTKEEHGTFYQVQVITKANFPNISPAADPKILSAAQMPNFVRILAINACVFSQAWERKDDETEFYSPWRSRLTAIKTLQDRCDALAKQNEARRAAEAVPPASSGAFGGRRTPIPREEPEGPDERGIFVSKINFMPWVFGKYRQLKI